MDCRKVLCLLCAIGTSFANECSKRSSTASYLIDYGTQGGDGEVYKMPEKELFCLNITENPHTSNDSTQYQPESIEIIDSVIDNLTLPYFQHIDASAVDYLYILNNKIGVIESDAFQIMQNTLIHLSVNNNTIAAISQDAFSNLNKLKLLYLQNNSISVIEENFLRGSTNSLQYLDMNGNNIHSLPIIFENCQLQYLNLENNKITELPNVSNCKNLYLVIINNSINSLSSHSDEEFNLLYLNVNENNITGLTKYDLQKFKRIETLSLSTNPLFKNADITVDLFENNLLLKELYLSNTGIKNIQVGTFSKLNKLILLDLEYNNITYLPDGVFNGLNSLKKLYLTYNDIHSIQSPTTFSGLYNIELIYLSYNNLSHLSSDAFGNLTFLKYLYLENNQLRSIENDNWPDKLEQLDLNNNLFSCEVLQTLIENKGDIIFSGTSYDKINIKGITCYLEKCPIKG